MMDSHPDSNRHLADPLSEPAPSDAAIVRALDTHPAVHIPAGFAARVAALAVTQPPARRSLWTGLGPRVALASSAVLTATLFAFAPHAVPSLHNVRFDLELLLLAELGSVGYVLTRVGQSE